MGISDEMVLRAAGAVADFMFNDVWRTERPYQGDVEKFGDAVDEDFIGIARAALIGAIGQSTSEK
jgi:hypothetical protein